MEAVALVRAAMVERVAVVAEALEAVLRVCTPLNIDFGRCDMLEGHDREFGIAARRTYRISLGQ